MKISGAKELTQRGWGLELQRLEALLVRFATRPTALAIAVGLGLGIYTVGLATLSSHWAPLLAVAAIAPSIGVIVGNVRRLLMLALVFDVPFSIGRHLHYNLDAAKLGSLGGLNISVTTLVIPMLYALWIGTSLMRRGDGTRPWLRPATALAIYIGFVMISITQATSRSLSIYEIFMLLQSLMIFVYIASTVRTRDDVVFLVVVLATAVLLESLLMLFTYATKHDLSFAGISTRIDPATSAPGDVSRVGGTVGGPNAAAAFLDLLLAPVLSLALVAVRRSYRLIATAAFVIGCVALVLTQSRGGWIAVALSCAIVVGYAWHRGWIPGLAPALVLITVGVIVYLFRDELLTRFLSDDAGSASSRIPLIRLAFHMIQDHLFFGVGANNFGINISHYATPEFSADWLYTVHNRYLLIWAEDGIGALIAFVAFLLATLRRGWQCRAMGDQVLAALAVGLAAGVLGQMVHMMVDILNGRQQVQLLIIVAGLLAALVAIKHETDPVPTPPKRWERNDEPLRLARLEPAPVPVSVYDNVRTRRVGS